MSMTETETKRPSKTERLVAEIEAAKARLAALHTELDPKIAAEQAKLDEATVTERRAQKDASNAYEALRTARLDATERLFPDRGVLLAQIRAFIAARGLPDADVETLAREHTNAAVAADPEVLAQQRTSDLAEKTLTAARRARAVLEHGQIAFAGTPLVRMRRQIDDLQVEIRKMEKELELLPQRREAARQARAVAARETAVDEETKAARALLSEFVFDGSKS